jgi:hypothetical protein
MTTTSEYLEEIFLNNLHLTSKSFKIIYISDVNIPGNTPSTLDEIIFTSK